jgi:hypothetical protein
MLGTNNQLFSVYVPHLGGGIYAIDFYILHNDRRDD